MLTLLEHSEYHNYIVKNYFYICEQNSVIELGPFHGWHSKLILSTNPTSLDLVEPNLSCAEFLTQLPATLHQQDCFEFYSTERPANVVVCCGLLYHLHSPLMLLENIVNLSNPTFIVVDNSAQYNSNDVPVRYYEEEMNTPGNRFQKNKTCGLSVDLPYNIFEKAMLNLGYQVIYHDKTMDRFNVDTKGGWMALLCKNH